MTTYIFNDDVRSTLLDSIDASATTINVTNPVGVYNDPPSPGVGEIATLKIVDRLDNPSRKEIITYTGRSTVTGGYALTGVVRGANAALWEAGCFVIGLVSADYLATLATIGYLSANQSIRFSEDCLQDITGDIVDIHSAVFDPPILELTNGLIVSFQAAGDSYLPNATFTPNILEIAPIEIFRFDNSYAQLEVGDIQGSYWSILQYNADEALWILLNPNISIVGDATQTALDLKLDIIDANKHLTIIDETGGVIVVNTENNSLPIVDETGATLFVDLVVSDQETVHTFTTYTASHALTLADASTISNSSPIVEMNVATANTLTVPPNSSVEFVIGSKIDAVQIGAGQTTITPGSGVTIYGTPGLKLRAQYSGVTLIKKAINTWYALGDLSA